MNQDIQYKIEQVMEKYDPFGNSIHHERQVCRLANLLFDGLKQIHHLDQNDRILLSIAALLHDTGLFFGEKAHHKKSRDIIYAELSGILEQQDLLIVAAVARYHRKALPDISHNEMADLSNNDRYRVNALASLIRIADGLDYSHTSTVTALQCICTDNSITIQCSFTVSQTAELIRAKEKSDLACRTFNHQVEIIDNKNI